MAITDQQINDLRADFGDEDYAVFQDDELSRIWDRTNSASNDVEHHFAALALMFLQVLSTANKLHDYKAGSLSNNESQIRRHLKDSYEMFKPYLNSAMGRQTQMAMATLRPRKNQNRTFPADDVNNSNDDSSI